MKTTFDSKIALVLGADTPLGRAACLQLSRAKCRVLLAGRDAKRLRDLVEFIARKKGDSLETVLPLDPAKAAAVLRLARDSMGHAHFVVNAMACTKDPATSAPDAIAIQEAFLGLAAGRGVVRLVTLWPDAAGDPPPVPDDTWACMVRFAEYQDDFADDVALPGKTVRAAGAADSVVAILSCPPSACPISVRLEQRDLKN